MGIDPTKPIAEVSSSGLTSYETMSGPDGGAEFRSGHWVRFERVVSTGGDPA